MTSNRAPSHSDLDQNYSWWLNPTTKIVIQFTKWIQTREVNSSRKTIGIKSRSIKYTAKLTKTTFSL